MNVAQGRSFTTGKSGWPVLRWSMVFLLCLALVLGTLPVQAEVPPPGQRPSWLANVSGEVSRVLLRYPELDPSLQSTAPTGDELRHARMRARLENTPHETKLTLTLTDGEVVHGELRSVDEDGFVILVERRPEDAGRLPDRVRPHRRLSYDDVVDASGGPWSALDGLEVGWENGRRGSYVELLRLDGSRIRGRLTDVSPTTLSLEPDGDGPEQLALEELAGFRVWRRPDFATKAVLGFGVAVGVILLTFVITCPDGECLRLGTRAR